MLQRIPCQDHDAISSHHAQQHGHNNKDAFVLTGPGHQYKGGHRVLPLNVRKEAEERMADIEATTREGTLVIKETGARGGVQDDTDLPSEEGRDRSPRDRVAILNGEQSSTAIPKPTSRGEKRRLKQLRKLISNEVMSTGFERPEMDDLISDPAPAAAILEKVDRIGEIDVLEGLRDTISDLRTGADGDGLCSHEGINQIIPNHLENQPASTQKLWLLKEELNLNKLDKQIHRLRKRLGLAEFFNTYVVCALRYVETKRTAATEQVAKNLRRGRNVKTNPGARNSHCDRSVLCHFVDLLFPNTTVSGKGKRVGRKKGELTRRAATRKVQNWRKAGKLWAHLIARFGKGILLLMPKEISDEE